MGPHKSHFAELSLAILRATIASHRFFHRGALNGSSHKKQGEQAGEEHNVE
jgi:hypothetical protein